MRFFKYFLLSLFLFIGLQGCTSMQNIKDSNTPQQILENVSPGDLINVETVDGTKQQILVESITEESLKSDEVEIPLEDIVNIKKEQISVLKTASNYMAGKAIVSTIAIILIIAF